jgi:hypothetical protein
MTDKGSLPASLKVMIMDSPFRTFFRTLADYTVGTAIVVAQLALADRRARPALASGRR